MMACFEKYFGKYPFIRDGYKLVESPHTGMEHQSAVAYGNRYLGGYRGRTWSEVGLKFDFIIVHESAHEWWGNSLTSKDIADMWIHESFGAYSEALFVECMYGREESLKYINGKKPTVQNDRPIIGVYNVQKSGSGDMYDKGQLVLNTLRSVIDNDSLWFAILRGLHETFKYKTITADDVFQFISKAAGSSAPPASELSQRRAGEGTKPQAEKDLGYFFDQYFRHIRVPQLVVETAKKGDVVRARYRWNADVKDFRMPIKVMTSPGKYEFIHPTTEWQMLELHDMKPEDFRIADDLFLADLKLRWSYLDPAMPDTRFREDRGNRTPHRWCSPLNDSRFRHNFFERGGTILVPHREPRRLSTARNEISLYHEDDRDQCVFQHRRSAGDIPAPSFASGVSRACPEQCIRYHTESHNPRIRPRRHRTEPYRRGYHPCDFRANVPWLCLDVDRAGKRYAAEL
jgi:hypothetical protein